MEKKHSRRDVLKYAGTAGVSAALGAAAGYVLRSLNPPAQNQATVVLCPHITSLATSVSESTAQPLKKKNELDLTAYTETERKEVRPVDTFHYKEYITDDALYNDVVKTGLELPVSYYGDRTAYPIQRIFQEINYADSLGVDPTTKTFHHSADDLEGMVDEQNGVDKKHINLYAPHDGIVRYIGPVGYNLPNAGKGQSAEVIEGHTAQGDIFFTIITHNNPPEGKTLKVGEIVKAGDYIAREGKEGYAIRRHLHAEIVMTNQKVGSTANFFLRNDDGSIALDPEYTQEYISALRSLPLQYTRERIYTDPDDNTNYTWSWDNRDGNNPGMPIYKSVNRDIANKFLSGVIEMVTDPAVQAMPVETVQPASSLDMLQLTEYAPNKDIIDGQAKEFMKFAPGGFNLSLDVRQTLSDLEAESQNSFRSNLHALNERTVREMALCATLEATTNPKLRDELLAKNYELVQQIDDILKTNEWVSIAKKATLGDWMRVMQLSGSLRGRIWAMNQIDSLVQAGRPETMQYGIAPLSNAKIDWCNSRDIDPKVLTWTEIGRRMAIDMMNAAPEVFFDYIYDHSAAQLYANRYNATPAYPTTLEQAMQMKQMYEEIKQGKRSVDEIAISAGGLAELNMRETGLRGALKLIDLTPRGFVYIGDTPVSPQWNLTEGNFPSAPNDLAWIAQELENSIKFPYTSSFVNLSGNTRHLYDYIPGSIRAYQTSGGAIFGQFMPIHLMEFMQKYNNAQEKMAAKGIHYPPIMPGTPWGMALLQTLYLCGATYFKQGQVDGSHTQSHVLMGGYIAGYTSSMQYSLLRWNYDGTEMQGVIDSAKDYYLKFPMPQS